MNRVTRICSLCFLATLVAYAGCAASKSKSRKFAKSLDPRRAIGLKSEKPAQPEIPMRMVSSWTDTVLNQTGQKPQRGFGGRLTFFGQDREKPVRIDGQLVVYAFEETEGQPRSTQPTRRFIFPKEQFVRHESKSALGPSYSIWLPWDEVGGERKNISLIARFEPEGGPLIVGEQTRHLLPGRAALVAKESPSTSNSQVQLAQHAPAVRSSNGASTIPTWKGHVVPALAVETAPQPKTKMTTTSIPLSNNWKQRLAITKKK